MWEEMCLEIKNLKKSFGTQANRTEVLKGIDFSVEKEKSVCCSDRQAPESRHF